MNLLIFSTVEIVMLSALILFFIIQIVYHLGLYGRIYRQAKDEKNENIPYQEKLLPLSVIITARDDSENLEKFLPSVLEQDYPNFEVIVVNDGATDESNDLLTTFASKYENLYHTFTPNDARYVSYKKLALTVGIKAAKNEWLVFTEPNCKPISDQWLRQMARNFTESTEVVLGYNSYSRGKEHWHHKVKFLNFFNQLRSLGFAIGNNPYMGIGRNMAYRKSLFFKNKGYSSHLNLQRGDDDLFINEVATPYNTRVEVSPLSIVSVEPFDDRKRWEEERTSYRSTAAFFHGLQRYSLGFETTTRLLYLLATLSVIIYSSIIHQWIMLGTSAFFFILYFVMQIIIFNRVATVLHEPKHYILYLRYAMEQPIESLINRIHYSASNKREYSR